MGASIRNNGGGKFAQTTLAEINVTPLVDVMLVLLIVFMVSAPLMQQGVQVDLPKANAQSMSEVPDQLTLVINRQKQISINNNVIAPQDLRVKLKSIVQVKPEIQVLIQADQNIPYGFVAEVMAEIKQSKISKVGLVTDPAGGALPR